MERRRQTRVSINTVGSDDVKSDEFKSQRSWQENSAGAMCHLDSDMLITADRVEYRGVKYALDRRDLQIDPDVQLGSGNTATVYFGVFCSSQMPVAVKQMRVDDQEKRDTMLHEIRALSDASKASGLIQWYGAYTEPSSSTVVFVLEYMDWGCVKKLLDRLGGMGGVPADKFACILRQALDGLNHLHYKGDHSLVHRDLKPANILLNRQGVAKLTDFGLARDVDFSTLDCASGTKIYCAPEELDPETIGEIGLPADVWSLGIVVYECVTGQHPFAGCKNFVTLFEALQSAPEPRLDARYPAALQSFVNGCVSRAPDQRPTTAMLMAHTYVNVDVCPILDVGIWLTELHGTPDTPKYRSFSL